MKLYNAEENCKLHWQTLINTAAEAVIRSLAVMKNILMIKCTKSYVGNYYPLSFFRIVFRNSFCF